MTGLGTRMLSATKAILKEMLPLVDKLLIQYIVNECVSANVKEIVLVTHSSKNAIENHFDTSYEQEAILEKRVKRQFLDEVNDVTIVHVRQGHAKGLGHAVLCAKPLVGDAPFAVVLPDVNLGEYNADQSAKNLAAMVRRYESTQLSQIMVEPVPMSEVSKYGVVDYSGAALKGGESHCMTVMIEKPVVVDAPSNLAVVGRYVLSLKI